MGSARTSDVLQEGNPPTRKARQYFMVSGLALIGKVIAFVRDQLIAFFFGTSSISDAFYVALSLPTYLFNVLFSALRGAFVPVYTQYRTEGRPLEAQRAAGGTLVVVSVISLLLSAGLFIGAPKILAVFAPGLHESQLAPTVLAVRILAPGLFFWLVGGFLQAYLNAHEEFSLPVLGPVVQNVLLIILTVGLYRYGLIGLGVATTAAMIVQTLIMVPKSLSLGLGRTVASPITPQVRRVGTLAGPLVMAGLLVQVAPIVGRSLATLLSQGSVAALAFADKVRQLPVTVFTAGLATVMLPDLSTQAARSDYKSIRRAAALALSGVFALMAPLAAGAGTLAQPIVRVLFERGAFSADSTATTAGALMAYMGSTVPLSLQAILFSVCYAIQDTRTPLVGIAISTASEITLSVLLVRVWGHIGIAMASTIAATAGVVYVLVRLAGGQVRLELADYGRGLWRSLQATAVMTTAVYFVAQWLGLYGHHRGAMFTTLGLMSVSVLGVTVYVAVLYLLKADELQLLRRIVQRKRISGS